MASISESSSNMQIENREVISLFRHLYLIRTAEEAMADYYFKNKIMSFVHFSIGQEIVGASFGMAARKSDKFLGNHRSHHHFLAKGGDVKALFAEMLGKTSGFAKGKGGSMHMFDPSIGFVGSSPILSSSIPIALGVAKNLKERCDDDVVVVFTGDGATEEGNFYESLNLASLWSLPVVIVVEDNNYAVNSTREARRPPGYSLRDLAGSMGIPYFYLASKEPLEAVEIAIASLDHSRSHGPSIVHARVTRYLAHSSPLRDDDAPYRHEVMGEERELFDPVKIVKEHLNLLGLETERERIEQEIKSLIKEAIELAVSAPDPRTDSIAEGVYAKIH